MPATLAPKTPLGLLPGRDGRSDKVAVVESSSPITRQPPFVRPRLLHLAVGSTTQAGPRRQSTPPNRTTGALPVRGLPQIKMGIDVSGFAQAKA